VSKSASNLIRLGYEMESGVAVNVPLGHTVVTGMTQLAGKTTALEALIHRSGKTAIVFITKRGEGAFAGPVRKLDPYFADRADWRFVESIIESTMREKNRIMRSWIMRASRGAKVLADVERNVDRELKKNKSGFAGDMYLQLKEYLRIVVPQIQQVEHYGTPTLEYQGLNVMDLSAFTSEMQGLIIRSVLEWVYETLRDVITVIPEAWEFVPQKRSSPVMLAAETLIRKGAALRNFLWLDSQDLAGVNKDIVRQAQVWILGVQREVNEVRRTLSHIPDNVIKPKPAQIMALGRGEFFVCFGRDVRRVYVQPAFMDDDTALNVALGHMSAEEGYDSIVRDSSGERIAQSARPETVSPQSESEEEEPTVTEKEAHELREENAGLREQVERLKDQIAMLDAGIRRSTPTRVGTGTPIDLSNLPTDERTYQMVKERLLKEAPGILKLLVEKPSIELTVERKVIEADLSNAYGRCAMLLSEGFFDGRGENGSKVQKELTRRGLGDIAIARLYESLDKLVTDGFLVKEKQPDRTNLYIAVEEMKDNVRVKRKAA